MEDNIIYFKEPVVLNDKIVLYSAGKFGEEKLVLDKAKAGLLFVELWKFLEFDLIPTYSEEEVRVLFQSIKLTQDFAKQFNLPCDIVELFEKNKKK